MQNKVYTKRKADKLAIGAVVSVVVGLLVITTYIVDTSKWAQATDDVVAQCADKIETNKEHIRLLEEKESENRRFQGEVNAKLDSVQASQLRQEAMIMQLISNSTKILNGSNGSRHGND